jgi:hypothetical protein
MEQFAFDTREDLKIREGFYIRNYPCCNKNIPGRTTKEWLMVNKEKIQKYQKQYQKEYHLRNKEKIKEYQRCYKFSDQIKIRQNEKKQIAHFVINNWLNQVYIKNIIAK